MFISLTAKKFREFSKIEIFKGIYKDLILSILYLMKKNVIFCETYYNALLNKENIFNDQYFDDFSKTEEYVILISTFSQNKKNFKHYFEMYVERLKKKEKDFFGETLKEIENETETNNINNFLYKMFIKIKNEEIDFSLLQLSNNEPNNKESESSSNKKKINMNSYLMESTVKIKREYYLMLTQMFYSIETEKHFPVHENNKFFDWKLFNDKLNTNTTLQFQQIINC